MIREITLGQYFPVDSPIHRLDARVKIIGVFVFVIGVFLLDSFLAFAVVAALLGIVIKLSKVPISFMLRGLKPIFLILAFTFVLNMLLIDGEVLVKFWIFSITREGLERALFMAIRLVILILGSSLLTFATKPISLTDGIERMLRPLKPIGVPAHELAMMMTIALRFIPTLLEETDKIIKAQQARGADFETGNLLQRAKSMTPILVPLFISAFRIAQEMAMAMDSRCYHGGEHRTRMNEMRYGKWDAVAYVLIALFMAGCIAMRIYW